MRKTTNKARINYWVDALIALAFVAVSVSGIVLLLAPSSGYRGGRNPAATRDILLLSRTVWRDLHDWSGVALVAGVLGHLVLHASWIACMTRNLFRRVPKARGAVKSCETEAYTGA